MRPSRCLEISAQRFAPDRLRCRRISSSSGLQGSFLIHGFKWLCQRSLHYFPMRPGRCLAISVHLIFEFSPEAEVVAAAPAEELVEDVEDGSASDKTILSSAALHGPLTSSGFSTFCHRCKHCTSVRRKERHRAIFFQLRAWCFSTAAMSSRSSALVQWPLLAPSWYLVTPVL